MDLAAHRSKHHILLSLHDMSPNQAMTIQVMHDMIREVQRDKEAGRKSPKPKQMPALEVAWGGPLSHFRLSKGPNGTLWNPRGRTEVFKVHKVHSQRPSRIACAEQIQKKKQKEGTERGLLGRSNRAWLRKNARYITSALQAVRDANGVLEGWEVTIRSQLGAD